MTEEGVEVTFKGDAGPLKSASDQAVESIEKFNKAAAKSSAAAYDTRYAIIDLSHVFRDLPYAISNPQILAGPFDRMTEAIINTKAQLKEGQTVLATFAQSLMGGGGIMIALSLLTDAFVFFGKDLFSSGTEVDSFKGKMDSLNLSLEETKKQMEAIQNTLNFANKLGAVNNDIFKLPKSVDVAGQSVATNEAIAKQEEIVNKLLQQKLDFQESAEDLYATDKERGEAKKQLDAVNKVYEEAFDKWQKMQEQQTIVRRQVTQAKVKEEDEARKEQEDANKKAEAEAKRHAAELLRLEMEALAAHRQYLKDMGIARTPFDNHNLIIPNAIPNVIEPKVDPRIKALLTQNLGNQEATNRNHFDFSGVKNFLPDFDRFIDKMKNLTELGKELKTVFESSFQAMFSAINNGKPALEAFFQAIIQSVEQLISKLAAAALAAFILSAVSGGSTSFAAKFSEFSGLSFSKHAAGGIAYGPSIGMIGEYANAGSNPEVIAPLSKLKSMIGDVQSSRSSESRIYGTDIILSEKRTAKQLRRIS